ncbi:hypothetical protein BV25DRAFT_1827890 [Artomyces pyxidatus]|uniref:Uncharacterized protein n=1 Tax=Artomyces pyxidatus TaxID=48021 RepID=A0ACB8SV71_9AGAM|nr:hypothetical protein BV25DRAFT_1827890 [Artomyces pyxidatus]
MPDITIEAAIIIALFMESVFYGLYLVTFGICMRVLLFKKSATARRPTLIAVALLLFIIATMNIAFSLRHVLDAFVWYKGPGGAEAQLYDISNPVNAMKTVDYVIQTIVGDGMLLYRCFVVYGRDWRIIAFPILIWITSIVLGIITCQITFSLNEDALLNAKRLVPFVTAALSTTMALNIIATSLILLRLWTIQRRTPDSLLSLYGHRKRGSFLGRVILIIIESASMYTFAVLIFFVVYTCTNNAEYAVADCIVQIIGIAFNFIIVRTSQGWTVEPTITVPLTSQITIGSVFPLSQSRVAAAEAFHARTAKHDGSHGYQDSFTIPGDVEQGQDLSPTSGDKNT